MVETPSHEMVLFEIPAGLLYTHSHDPAPNHPVLTSGEIIIMYKTNSINDLPLLTNRHHTPAPFTPPRICRPLFALAQSSYTLPVGVIETKWSLSRGSSPGPYCRMDNRRRSLSTAYICTERLARILSPSLACINPPEDVAVSMEEMDINSSQSDQTMMSMDAVYEDRPIDPVSVAIGREIGYSLRASLGYPAARLTSPPDSPRPEFVPLPEEVFPSYPASHFLIPSPSRRWPEQQVQPGQQGSGEHEGRPRRQLARNPAKHIGGRRQL